MGHGLYILKDKTPVLEPDVHTWGRWIQKAERHVDDERIGDYRISTVFLGLDHAWGEDVPPVLWESMIFTSNENDPLSCDCRRCSGSWEQAESMHAKMVEKVKQHIKEKEKNDHPPQNKTQARR
jgi:hypothetical protein